MRESWKEWLREYVQVGKARRRKRSGKEGLHSDKEQERNGNSERKPQRGRIVFFLSLFHLLLFPLLSKSSPSDEKQG